MGDTGDDGHQVRECQDNGQKAEKQQRCCRKQPRATRFVWTPFEPQQSCYRDGGGKQGNGCEDEIGRKMHRMGALQAWWLTEAAGDRMVRAEFTPVLTITPHKT